MGSVWVGVAGAGLVLAVVLVGGCFGGAEDGPDGEGDVLVPAPSATATPAATLIPLRPATRSTPTASGSPTDDEGGATVMPTATAAPTAEPEGWWVVAESTWEDTFHVSVEIYGASTLTSEGEFRARTRLENVGDESQEYIRWSQFDPAVPTWMALPAPPVSDDSGGRPALRLIALHAVGDDFGSAGDFPQTVTDSLEPGDVVEREVSWDLTTAVSGSRERAPAADGVYTLRVEFYPRGGNQYPGLPDVLLEFPVVLERE